MTDGLGRPEHLRVAVARARVGRVGTGSKLLEAGVDDLAAEAPGGPRLRPITGVSATYRPTSTQFPSS